jgi:hypothetical protein
MTLLMLLCLLQCFVAVDDSAVLKDLINAKEHRCCFRVSESNKGLKTKPSVKDRERRNRNLKALTKNLLRIRLLG